MAKGDPRQCREHGGIFYSPPRRGRPPVRCNPENLCTRAPGYRDAQAEGVANAVARTLKGAQPKPTIEDAQRMSESMGGPSDVDVSNAHHAKKTLEPMGWSCSARKSNAGVDFQATRGDELIVIRFEGGKSQQAYTLWDIDKPSKNYDPRMPPRRLTFDPDETSDREIVSILQGQRVTWWNRISGATETAVVSPNKVQVQHSFNGREDETPGERTLLFVDFSGSTGYRAFRLDALLKVG